MKEELFEILIKEIKSKKQIEDLEDNFIKSRLEQFFLTNGDIRKKLENEFEKNNKIIKSKIFKEIIKSIREEIGIVYGSFLTNEFKKKKKYLENKDIKNILHTHKSTREREEYYFEIFTKIFEWYIPKKGIADLACGQNPINYSLITSIINKEINYYASDLNPKDMEFIQEFFNKNNIKGKAIAHDITQINFIKDKEFLNCDLVFLFKALDSFETLKKDISKEILSKIPQSQVVISFPTKSIKSQLKFKPEKRNWLRNFLTKKEWKFKEFEVENEMFFLVEKERPRIENC